MVDRRTRKWHHMKPHISWCGNVGKNGNVVTTGKIQKELDNATTKYKCGGTVSKNGWMDEEQYLVWLKQNFTPPADENWLLVHDMYKAHMTDKVKNWLAANRGVNVYVAPGCTGFLQVHDVAVMKNFKKEVVHRLATSKAKDALQRVNRRTHDIVAKVDDIRHDVVRDVCNAVKALETEKNYRDTVDKFLKKLIFDVDDATSLEDATDYWTLKNIVPEEFIPPAVVKRANEEAPPSDADDESVERYWSDDDLGSDDDVAGSDDEVEIVGEQRPVVTVDDQEEGDNEDDDTWSHDAPDDDDVQLDIPEDQIYNFVYESDDDEDEDVDTDHLDLLLENKVI